MLSPIMIGVGRSPEVQGRVELQTYFLKVTSRNEQLNDYGNDWILSHLGHK
jgi:hypothetical protein